MVYVGSEDYNVYALNAETGTLLGSFATGYWVDSSPAVANGVVYVGSDDGNGADGHHFERYIEQRADARVLDTSSHWVGTLAD